MTSVLYSAGLNYQGGNPLRTEIRGLRTSITALEALTQEQSSQITALKLQMAVLEKAIQAAAAAAAAATAAADAASKAAADATSKADAASKAATAATATAATAATSTATATSS